MVLSKTQITEALIRLHGSAGWSAPVLFANLRRQVFLRRGQIFLWAGSWDFGSKSRPPDLKECVLKTYFSYFSIKTYVMGSHMLWVVKRTVSMRRFFRTVSMRRFFWLPTTIPEVSSIAWRVYFEYFSSGSGVLRFTVLLTLLVIAEVFFIVYDWWLSYWWIYLSWLMRFWHSEKSATIRESNLGSGVYKEHYV